MTLREFYLAIGDKLTQMRSTEVDGRACERGYMQAVNELADFVEALYRAATTDPQRLF